MENVDSESNLELKVKVNHPKSEAVWTSREDEFLSCQETLDRSSPTIWPQSVPGLLDFMKKSEPEWKLGESEWDLSKLEMLEADDYELIYCFRDSKPNQLMEQIQEINDYAYQLNIEESKEVNRGIILQIFDDKSEQNS